MTLYTHDKPLVVPVQVPKMLPDGTIGSGNKCALIRQHKLAKKLDMSMDMLRKLGKIDPSFPAPLKCGDTRQAPVFYILAEVEAWLESKKLALKTV